jgi:hypothetical protein
LQLNKGLKSIETRMTAEAIGQTFEEGHGATDRIRSTPIDCPRSHSFRSLVILS